MGIDFYGSVIQVVKAMQVVERGHQVDYTSDDLNGFHDMFGSINPACLPALLTFFEDQKMNEISKVIQAVMQQKTATESGTTLLV